MQTTRLSTRGRITLPKGIRASHGWAPGTEFTVEETAEGILVRPTRPFPASTLEEVAGCLRGKRKPRTRAQMRAVRDNEVKRRSHLGRY